MDLSRLIELVWIGGLAATPIVVGVSILCRSPKLRPATKHALWAAALASFLTPLAVAAVWRNTWFESDRVLSLADRVLPAGATSHGEGTDHGAVATDPAAKTAISSDAPRPRRAAKEPERTVAKTPLQHPIAMAMKTAEGFGTVANPSADRVTACVDATHGAAG
ncbi:MAG: hypothetical protein JNL50_01745, partial [Phycisphaerae bacterium]|nr:hypothetical protein [Phycisphaerae bacterium]